MREGREECERGREETGKGGRSVVREGGRHRPCGSIQGTRSGRGEKRGEMKGMTKSGERLRRETSWG